MTVGEIQFYGGMELQHGGLAPMLLLRIQVGCAAKWKHGYTRRNRMRSNLDTALPARMNFSACAGSRVCITITPMLPYLIWHVHPRKTRPRKLLLRCPNRF